MKSTRNAQRWRIQVGCQDKRKYEWRMDEQERFFRAWDEFVIAGFSLKLKHK